MAIELETQLHRTDSLRCLSLNNVDEQQEEKRENAKYPLGKEISMEQVLTCADIPTWSSQITFRGILVSAMLGALFCIIVHKLALTTGIIPSLNVSAGLLSFFFIKSWMSLLNKLGIADKPFTRQENTVIQTCIVACYGVAFSGGYSTYLIAMDQRTHDIVSASGESPGDSSASVKNPELGWIIAYAFASSFLGLVAVFPLRKIMIVDYKLTYPSGTATAVLINSFHTPHGFKQARLDVYLNALQSVIQ